MPVNTYSWDAMTAAMQKRIRWLEKKSYPRHLRGLSGVDDDTLVLVWTDSADVVWGYLMINPYDDPDEPVGCDAWILDFCVGKQERQSARAALALVAAVRQLATAHNWRRIRMQLRRETTARLLRSLDHEVLGEGLGNTIDVAVNLTLPSREMGTRSPMPMAADSPSDSSTDYPTDATTQTIAQAAYLSDDSIAEPLQRFVEGVLAGDSRSIEWHEPDAALTVRLVVTRDGHELNARFGAWPMDVDAQSEVQADNDMRPSIVRLWASGSFHRVVTLPIAPAFASRHQSLPSIPLEQATRSWTHALGTWFSAIQDVIYRSPVLPLQEQSADPEPSKQVAGTRSQARRYDAEDWQREAELDLIESAQEAREVMPLSRQVAAALAAIAIRYLPAIESWSFESVANISPVMHLKKGSDPWILKQGAWNEEVDLALDRTLQHAPLAIDHVNRFFRMDGPCGLAVALLLVRHGYVEMPAPDYLRKKTASLKIPASLHAEVIQSDVTHAMRPLERDRAVEKIANATQHLLDMLTHFDVLEQANHWHVPVMLLYAIHDAGLTEDETRQIVRLARRYGLNKRGQRPTDYYGHHGVSGTDIIDVFRRFGSRGLDQWLKLLPRPNSAVGAYNYHLPRPQRTSVERLGADIKLQHLGIAHPQQWLLRAHPKMGPFGRLCVTWAGLHNQGECSPEHFAQAVNDLRWLGEDGASRLRAGGLGYRKIIQLIQTLSRDEVMAWASLDASDRRLLKWRDALVGPWAGFVAGNKRQLQRVLAAEPLVIAPLPIMDWSAFGDHEMSESFIAFILPRLFSREPGGFDAWFQVLDDLDAFASRREFVIALLKALKSSPYSNRYRDPSAEIGRHVPTEERFLLNARVNLVDDLLSYFSVDQHVKLGTLIAEWLSHKHQNAEWPLLPFLQEWWADYHADPRNRPSATAAVAAHSVSLLDAGTLADVRRGLRQTDWGDSFEQLYYMAPQARGLYITNKTLRRALDTVWRVLVILDDRLEQYTEYSLYVAAFHVALVKAGRHSGVRDLFAHWGIDMPYPNYLQDVAAEENPYVRKGISQQLQFRFTEIHDRGVLVRDTLATLTPESATYLVDHAKSPHLKFHADVAFCWDRLLQIGRNPRDLDHRSRADVAILQLVRTSETVRGYDNPDHDRIPAGVSVCVDTDTMQVLPKSHPWTLASGLETGSCIRPGGEGFAAGEHAFTSPDGAFLGILTANKLPAGAWVWRDGSQLMVDSLDGEWSARRCAMLLAWAFGTVGRMGITRILLNHAYYGTPYRGILSSIQYTDHEIEINYPPGSYTGDFTGEGYMLAVHPTDPLFPVWLDSLREPLQNDPHLGLTFADKLLGHLSEFMPESAYFDAAEFIGSTEEFDQPLRIPRPEHWADRW